MSRGGSDKQKPPSRIAGGKFEVDKRLGAGCFGEVWRGIHVETKMQIAVKFEDIKGNAPQLEHEANILRLLATPEQQQGFAECLYFGLEGPYRCMVQELLGKSLEDRVQQCGGKFNVESAVLIADQALRRIEYMHSRGFVHRDIKPENFMFGVRDKIHHIYVIDFGLSKRYFEGTHVQVRTKLSLTGTARYASINAHLGYEQSRRDDLEAIGHMLMYFLRGSLPWSGLDAKTQHEKYKRICDKKKETPLDELCMGFPDAFKIYLKTARSLEFAERPKYVELRGLFKAVRDARNLQDHQFQWLEGRELETLTPIIRDDNIRQPDDKAPPQKSRFCLCGRSGGVKD